MKPLNSRQTIKIGSHNVELNTQGYLINFNDWNEDIARIMAQNEDIELSDFHWLTFDYLRQYYDKHQVPPSPRVIIRTVGDKSNIWGYTSSTFKRTFPKGGYKQACRLAGLPTHRLIAC